MSNDNDDIPLPPDVPDSLGWGPKFHKPDGKPLHRMALNDPNAKAIEADSADEICPAEYVMVEARDLNAGDLLDLGKKGLRLASSDELAGHDIPVVRILKHGHGDGLGILKRYGKKRYELWLNTRETEAATAAQLKLNNAQLAAEQARPSKVLESVMIEAVPTVTINVPGEPPESFSITPRPQKPGLWARFVAFLKQLFTSSPVEEIAKISKENE